MLLIRGLLSALHARPSTLKSMGARPFYIQTCSPLPRFPIMSPWITSGNIIQYTQTNPCADRLMLVFPVSLEIDKDNLPTRPTIACKGVPRHYASSWVTLGARGPGFRWEHSEYIAGIETLCLQCDHRTHAEYICDVVSLWYLHLPTDHGLGTFQICFLI